MSASNNSPKTAAAPSLGRRSILRAGLGLAAAAALAPALAACSSDSSVTNGSGKPAAAGSSDGPIKLGFLSDFTGTLATQGEIQFNCFNLAVNQINSAGGIAGREIQVIEEDDGSDSTQTIEKATKLALEDEVVAIVGGITSLTREAALTVLPAENVPYLYTTFYEGAAAGAVACDSNLISTGQVPNQQMEPLIPYLTENVGTSYMIVGSDYIWPRGTTEVLERLVDDVGGSVHSATYYPFGTTDFGPFLQELEEVNPDICWVSLAGADINTFLKQYQQFGASAQIAAISMDEVIASLSPGTGVGAITSQSYFMAVDNENNKKFLADYRTAYGEESLVNGIGEGAYSAVYLFKGAIEAADGSTDPEVWKPKLGSVTFEAPGGTIKVDPETQHVIGSNYIAQVNPDGTLKILSEQHDVAPKVDSCNLI